MDKSPQFPITDHAEVKRIYESARPSDSHWNKVALNVHHFEPNHVVTQDGRRLLDFHSQILSYSLDPRAIQEAVQQAVGDVNGNILGPNCTHPVLDETQAKLAAIFRELGWGEYEIAFRSSGTRANEDGLRLGRAMLGERMHLMPLREGYHGAGLMNAVCGHGNWKGSSTVPLGMPMSFLDHEWNPMDGGRGGRDYQESFGRILECDAAANAQPYLLAEAGVMGVGGFRNIDPRKLREMAVATHGLGGLVHYDAVQTMPGRTGEGLVCVDDLVDPANPLTIPDIVTSAKGLGGGEPFAFIAARKNRFDPDTVSGLGKEYDTFGRNLRGAAACSYVLDRVREPGFMENLRARSEELRDGLKGIAERHADKIQGLTGKGMMTGLELDSAGRVANFCKAGLEKTELMVGTGGIKGTVLRLGGRLDPTSAIIGEALQKIEDTLKVS